MPQNISKIHNGIDQKNIARNPMCSCTVVLGVIPRYQSRQFAGRQEAVVLSLLYGLFLLAPISNAIK
jgi:hypothetical protein